MEDVQVGDLVLTSQGGSFEPLFAFGHLDKAATASFLKIGTSSGASMEITGEHLLYVMGKTNPVRADSVKLGDKLQVAAVEDPEDSTVTKINRLNKKGLYAPLTPSGKIVVDGFMASSYVALKNSDDEYFSMLHGALKIAHQDFVHLYLAPFRVVCMGISDKPCQIDSDKGMPNYISWGMDAINFVHNTSGSTFLQMIFLAFTVPLLLAFAVVEAIFGAALGPLAVFSLAAAAVFYGRCFIGTKEKTV
jgi:hypothetical protein